MISRITIGSAVLLVGLSLLAGCSEPREPLPAGVITATGSIQAIPLSLERRGTHALLVGGEQRYFLEAGKVDLRSLEGKMVAVTGTVQANIDPKAKPLFLVQSVSQVHAEEDRPVTLSQLAGITVRVPASWGRTASGSTERFILADGSAVLSVGREVYTSDAGNVPLLVGGKQAYRLQHTSAMAVAVPQSDGSAIVLRSLLAKPTPETDAEFVRILTSVTFPGSPSSASSASAVSAGSGTVMGAPCGGAAGLLCPAGFYCSITDRVNNIGVCKQPQK